MPEIEVRLRHRAGPLDLDVAFSLSAPWTALFAPSGAGKTTILRMIAGLDQPDAGRISLANGKVLFDSERRIFVPPHRRGVRMVPQRPALFPHLAVSRNLQYGSLSRDSLDPLLALCRIAHLRDKMPSQLSGGERQRVALARTLASFPAHLLLLDEPFTGLEASLRDDIIHDLRAWTILQKTSVLLVTHDIGEVFAADAHVVRMEAGRIVASGLPSDVLATERDRMLARLNNTVGEL